MNWNPNLIATHYTWSQVIVSWTVVLPICIVSFMVLVATMDSLINVALMGCYNPKANVIKRFITLTIVCPTVVLIIHTIQMLTLSYGVMVIIDDCLTIRRRN